MVGAHVSGRPSRTATAGEEGWGDPWDLGTTGIDGVVVAQGIPAGRLRVSAKRLEATEGAVTVETPPVDVELVAGDIADVELRLWSPETTK